MTNHEAITQRAVPMLSYEDPATAIGWLERAFGFEERGKRSVDDAGRVTHAELDLGERAMGEGAEILRGREETPVGTLYTAADLEGHRWMFLQPGETERPDRSP